VKRSKRRRAKLPTLRQWRAMVLGSDRPGHLFAAAVTAIAMGVVAVLLRSPWVGQAGLVVVLWEWACTPDVDLANQRNRRRGSVLWRLLCWLWLPYAVLVGHRSRFSHSLALGLPCRLAYVGIVPLALVATGRLSLAWAGEHLVVLLTGAAIADTVHLLKDGYSLEQILWGQ
jgi:hypothetical protein